METVAPGLSFSFVRHSCSKKFLWRLNITITLGRGEKIFFLAPTFVLCLSDPNGKGAIMNNRTMEYGWCQNKDYLHLNEYIDSDHCVIFT